MSRYPGWPYCVKPVAQWEWFEESYLDIYLTFEEPMDILVKPAVSRFTILTEGDTYTPNSLTWIDMYTLLVRLNFYAFEPVEVKLKYTGPDILLRTTWHKQWEPFGYIRSMKYSS